MTSAGPSQARPAIDGRASNWRYVVPTDAGDPVVVGPGGASLDEVVAGPRLPAVVLPDLGSAVRAPRVAAQPRGARELLARLCAQVAPGGWFAVGFANRWYAARPLSRGSLGLAAARRGLRDAGLDACEAYIALPDHERPALLVPADHRSELDHV